ncbi:MAG TPA: glycosyltransferase family 2 protein [Alphaproteobacteria bacterium]|nr:glycosyltransferase family 2 protein [Alphaproteobacteria bacterium]
MPDRWTGEGGPRRHEPSASPDLSIVVPIYNEAENMDRFFARLDAVLDDMDVPAEVVCVDDGSSDASWDRLLEHGARDSRLRLVRLSRNFGKDVALACGLAHTAGRAVVPIDADLQHPPEVIAEFFAAWRAGYDMVYGIRRSRATDSRLRRIASRLFYRLFESFANVRMPPGAGDFRLLDRRVVDVLNQMPERARFMKGLFAWVGFRQIGIEYDVGERRAGGSAWSFRRLLAFAADGFASFSTLPLTLAGYLGAVLALPSLVLAGWFTVRTLIFGVDVPGYASVIVAVLMLGSIQLLTLGLFGAYLGRVFEEVKRRPLYVVSDKAGFESGSVFGDDVTVSRAPVQGAVRPSSRRGLAAPAAGRPEGRGDP